MAGSRWESHAHDLRAAADQCHEDAADLLRLTATTPWGGASGEAFRRALELQVRELRMAARALETAADLVAAHGRRVTAALAAVTAPVSAVEHVVDRLLQ